MLGAIVAIGYNLHKTNSSMEDEHLNLVVMALIWPVTLPIVVFLFLLVLIVEGSKKLFDRFL